MTGIQELRQTPPMESKRKEPHATREPSHHAQQGIQTPTKPNPGPHTNATSLLAIARQPSAASTSTPSSSSLVPSTPKPHAPSDLNAFTREQTPLKSPSPITHTWPSALIKLVSRPDTPTHSLSQNAGKDLHVTSVLG